MIPRVMPLALVTLAGCGAEQLTASAQPLPPTRLFYLDGEGIEKCGPSSIARGLALSLTPAVVDEAQTSLVALEAELTIADTSGNLVPFEKVNGSFRARFDRTGTYVLEATLGDGSLLTREVTVVEHAGLRLGRRGRNVVTHDTSGDCTTSVVEEAASPSLALNQELHAYVVPVDAHEEPLVGELELKFSGTMSVRAGLSDSRFNAYVFEPTEPGTNALTISDSTLQQAYEMSFDADGAPAVCRASE